MTDERKNGIEKDVHCLYCYFRILILLKVKTTFNIEYCFQSNGYENIKATIPVAIFSKTYKFAYLDFESCLFK